MDDNSRLLQEIRDLLRQHADATAADRADAKAYREVALAQQAAIGRLYRRVVTVGAVLLVLALVVLFSMLSRH